MDKISELICLKIFDIDENQSSLENAWTKYYVKSILVSLEKFSIVILVSLVTNTLILSGLTYVFFSFLRKFARGWHALSSLYCTVQSVLFYVLFPIFVERYRIELIWCIILELISITILIFFAPQATLRNPISSSQEIKMKQKVFNRASILFILTIFFKMNNFDNLANIVLYCMLLQVSLVLPITKGIIEGSFFHAKKD
jgi:Membrane protein putatively involved in post-translational modification of the autoinducing quorum-sensing peptide